MTDNPNRIRDQRTGLEVETLSIRYAGDAWESFYGELERMASLEYGAQLTTRDGQVHDGVLRKVDGDVFSGEPTVTVNVTNAETGDVIATVPLFNAEHECNIIGIVVW